MTQPKFNIVPGECDHCGFKCKLIVQDGLDPGYCPMCGLDGYGNVGKEGAFIPELIRPLYAEPPPVLLAFDSCVWRQDDADWNSWSSECGVHFTLEDGDPSANGMKYCHNCAKSIEIADPVCPMCDGPIDVAGDPTTYSNCWNECLRCQAKDGDEDAIEQMAALEPGNDDWREDEEAFAPLVDPLSDEATESLSLSVTTHGDDTVRQDGCYKAHADIDPLERCSCGFSWPK